MSRARELGVEGPFQSPIAESTPEEIDAAVRSADAAFPPFAAFAGRERARFLRAAADEVEKLGEALVDVAHRETAIAKARLEGERGRTANQLRMFAALLEEGSWVEARIDPALPDRRPPRPDLRRMLVPLGPVAVFGASNFPLAFSVAGGDTASALAAGCPVVVKAHPAHPGTSELAFGALRAAAEATGMPPGVVSFVRGASHAVGQALVTHALVKAVAFTGSFRGGKALFDAAARRPEPIPVYAEMGSANPVFVLPRALAARGDDLVRSLAASVTIGAGQFCTNPGLTVVPASKEGDGFLDRLGAALLATELGTFVHAGIAASYRTALDEASRERGVTVAVRAAEKNAPGSASAPAALLVTDARSFADSVRLREELYGPATVAVRFSDRAELLAAASALQGCLVAAVHGTDEDLAEHAELLEVLSRKAGRVVFGGMPTGVEVSSAMHHGGPWPSTTDARETSVGTGAIRRFARPVCFQNAPDAVLPGELKRANPLGISRLVEGAFTKEPA